MTGWDTEPRGRVEEVYNPRMDTTGVNHENDDLFYGVVTWRGPGRRLNREDFSVKLSRFRDRHHVFYKDEPEMYGILKGDVERFVEEAENAKGWECEVKHDTAQFSFTPRPTVGEVHITKMGDYNVQAWFVKKAKERGFDVRTTDNFEELRQLVLEETAERVKNRRDEWGDSPIAAFNNMTDEWPIYARALLAAYEAVEETVDDESYLDSSREYAEANGAMDEYQAQEGQTSLEWFDDSDLEMRDLTSEEATTAAILDSMGEDPSLIEEISNHEIFRERLEETDDAQLAIQYGSFDHDLPSNLIQYLSPPSEWSELDPMDVPAASCGMCGMVAWEVEHDNKGRTWVNEHNDTNVEITHDMDDYYSIDGHDPDTLCNSCEARMDKGFRSILTTSDGVVGCRTNHPLIKDLSAENGAFHEINDDSLLEQLINVSAGRPQEIELDQISAHDHPSNQRNDTNIYPLEQEALQDLFDEPNRLDVPGISVTERGGENNAYVQTGNYEALREIKEYLEETVITNV